MLGQLDDHKNAVGNLLAILDFQDVLIVKLQMLGCQVVELVLIVFEQSKKSQNQTDMRLEIPLALQRLVEHCAGVTDDGLEQLLQVLMEVIEIIAHFGIELIRRHVSQTV